MNADLAKKDKFKETTYLKLEVSDNKHIVILTDIDGNEFGRGSGPSTLASINNFYENFMAS